MTDNPYRPPRSGGMPSRPPTSLHAARMAKTVFENLREFHQPVHEYRVVDGRAFRRVSRRFYRRTQAQFEALGFTLLGDIEDVTVNNSRLKPRTFLDLEEIGWATPEYLISQGVRPDMVDEVYEEIQRLRAATRPRDGWDVEQNAERESPWDDSER